MQGKGKQTQTHCCQGKNVYTGVKKSVTQFTTPLP